MALNAHSHQNKTAPAAASKNATRPVAAAPAKPAKLMNSTNVVGALSSSDVIINKAPYEVTKCDQVIMLAAKRIKNFEDYTSRSPAFFTMSAYLINMFESKDNNKLLESINLAHIQKLPQVMKGSKNCLLFEDGVSHRNISMCIDKEENLEEVKKSYSSFMTCRMGGDLNSFDPVTINNVLSASCNGFNSTQGAQYDMPKIKAQIADELIKAGFKVDIGVGRSKFGLNNATSSNLTSVTAPKVIDYRVPGTY